jgi:hypothetical protein
MGSWILIRIANADQDLDPERGKLAQKIRKIKSEVQKKKYENWYFLFCQI